MRSIELIGFTQNEDRQEMEIPLKKVDVSLDINCNIACVTLTQYFENSYDKLLEALYTFPTPKSSCVFEFCAYYDDILIKALLEEKEAALKKYQENKEQGHGTFLLNRVDGDIFKCAIGNILPGKNIKIVTKYFTELSTEIDCTNLKLIFPLTIMPRYSSPNSIEAENKDNEVNNIPKVDFKPFEFSFSGKVFMDTEILKFETNPVINKKILQKDTNSLEFTFGPLNDLTKDISILINRMAPKTSAICEKMVCENPKFTYCTSVNIVPNFTEIEVPNINDIHYCIIIDSSGSMDGKPLENCKTAAIEFIALLPTESTFDIYHFGSTFFKFENDNKEDRKENAAKWIEGIKSSGGTEMFPVLEDAYLSFTDKNGIIVLLTDGEINNTDEVASLISKNSNVNVYSIGIGSNVSQHLVNTLAEVGRGVAQFVTSDDKDKIREIVKSQLQKSQQSLKKCNKDNKLLVETLGDYLMVGNKLPILYENDFNVFYIFSEKEITKLSYVQSYDNKNQMIEVPISYQNTSDNVLHKNAGLKYIEFLKHCQTNSQNKKNENIYNVVYKFVDGKHIEHKETNTDFKSEILATSLSLGVLSQYTSFIGVEHREDTSSVEKGFITKRIPLQIKQRGSNFFECRPSAYQSAMLSMGSVNKSLMGGSMFMDMDEEECCDEFIDDGLESLSDKSVAIESCSVKKSSHKQKKSNNNFKSLTSSVSAKINSIGNWFQNKLSSKSNSNFVANEHVIIEKDDHLVIEKEDKNKVKSYDIKLETDVELDNYSCLGSYFTSKVNAVLPIPNLNTNDIIRMTSNKIKGVFKIISLGSTNTPWVLEKLSD